MITKKLASLLSYCVLWIYAYFMPTYSLILIVGFFVFCDLITGVLASTRNEQGSYDWSRFNSKKLRNTVPKFTGYTIAILVAFVVEKHFNLEPACKVIAGFVMYIELKSLNENIETITGTNLFKTLIEQVSFKK